MHRVATSVFAGILFLSTTTAFAGDDGLKPGLPAGVHQAQGTSVALLAFGGIILAASLALLVSSTSAGGAPPLSGGTTPTPPTTSTTTTTTTTTTA